MRSRAKNLIKETTTSRNTFDVAQPKLPRSTGEGRGDVATRRETAHLFNILFSSPSLVLEFKTEPISTKNLPAQGLRKQYIEQENNLPLSKGEDAVVLAQASYKSGVRVHPVGLNTVMLNLFQHLTSMKLPLLAGQILNQVQDDTMIGGVPC